MDARAKKIQQQKRKRRNTEAILSGIMKAYNLGVQHMQEAVGIELGVGDKRMSRIKARHDKILSEWDDAALMKFAQELDVTFLKVEK